MKSPSLHSRVLGSRTPYRSSFDMALEGGKEGKVQTAAKASSQCGLVMSTSFQNGTEISIGDMEDTLWNNMFLLEQLTPSMHGTATTRRFRPHIGGW